MIVLAIETSCDDTCAAVLKEEGAAVSLLSNVVSSHLVHAEYEGIVPELASREHIRLIGPVINSALAKAGLPPLDAARGTEGYNAIDAIAATNGPGLIGSLLVGLSMGKALAYSLGIPIIGINHVEAHLCAVQLEFGREAVKPPFIGLVASGGHTEIIKAADWGSWDLLGATRDDAAGEAFDKVAKLLKMGFPGGPPISKAAERGDGTAVAFPRAWLNIKKGDLDFSFSGLKTAVKLYLEKNGWPHEPVADGDRSRFVADVTASFEAAVVDVLDRKIWKAVEITGIHRVVVAGGVAANPLLRRVLTRNAEKRGVQLFLPSPALCGDNAAMIGAAAINRLLRGERSGYDVAAIPNLDDWSGFYFSSSGS
jgi:tRNA N6-adenosine threonylcarbamoyltransferase